MIEGAIPATGSKTVFKMEIFDAAHSTARNKLADSCRKQWVAEITGLSEEYGLDRRFLRGFRDYSNANSVGSRGIVATYLLEDCHVYEVSQQINWRHSERYFCVARQGRLIKLTIEQVIEWLNERSALTS